MNMPKQRNSFTHVSWRPLNVTILVQILSYLGPVRILHDLPAFNDISSSRGTFSQAVTSLCSVETDEIISKMSSA